MITNNMSTCINKKLQIAVIEGDTEQVKVLINSGANVNHVFLDHGDTVLHSASTSEVVQFLLLKSAKVDVQDRYGRTPLCCAVSRSNCLEVVKVLIFAGANVNVKMANGKTPLHYAPNVEFTEVLLKNGAEVNAKDKYGCTPLHSALIERKGLEVFKCLLSAGADINATMGDYRNTVLHYADSLEIVREILSHGFDVNVKTINRQTPLHYAVKQMKDAVVIHELLKHGASVDAKDSEFRSALIYSVTSNNRNLEVIKLLLEYGANVNDGFFDFRRRRPCKVLDYAVSHDMECAKLIVRVYLLFVNGDENSMPTIDLDARIPVTVINHFLDYLNNCVSEIFQMKAYKIINNFSLYDIVAKNKVIMKPLYSNYRKLDEEMLTKFPVYHDIILSKLRPYLERGRLINRLRWLQLTSLNFKFNAVTLNPDCTYLIVELLPDDTLWNLLIASELNSF